MAQKTRPDPTAAQAVLPTSDLDNDLAFFTSVLGFRLQRIYPADTPRVAVMTGHGLCVRLESGTQRAPQAILIETNDQSLLATPNGELFSPGGTEVRVAPTPGDVPVPPLEPELIVNRPGDSGPWATGRAGMQYRDLVPGRLGGAVIASRIRIPQGGPVPDYVHYHHVRFQLIYCLNGWTDLVYEDQGPAFTLRAGDCVLQPPGIRHRVLECSDEFEVVEVGCPAEHDTFVDHDRVLPTAGVHRRRRYGGQRFAWHRAREATWTAFPGAGVDCRDTGLLDASGGVVSAVVKRARAGCDSHAWAPDQSFNFGYVLSGSFDLVPGEAAPARCPPGTAFVIPAGSRVEARSMTPDLQWLEVTAAI